MHPLAGHWIANIEKSRRHANHQFESATATFTVGAGEVVMAYDGINASGKRETSSQMFRADGQEHAIPQAPGFVAVSTLGERRLESMGKKDGTVLGRGIYEVSDDGQTMTATVSGIDAAGKTFDQVIVFDRA
jgi:hypothetical protein